MGSRCRLDIVKSIPVLAPESRASDKFQQRYFWPTGFPPDIC